jgi:signal transduction histidine kinase
MLPFLAGVAAGALLAGGASLWLYRRQQSTMGRFLSFAAHEINTPITAVNMTILNLLSGVFGEVNPEQVQWIEMMREQLVRLNGMVGELRDLTHMQLHDDLHIRPEEIAVADLVESAVRAIRYGCAHSGIGVDTTIPQGLPLVNGDPDRLPRVLSSLLFHARKFRSEGPLVLKGSPTQDGRFVEITIGYTGPILSAEETVQSLQLYFPARQRKDQNLTATGLGLGVLKEIMRLQGGDLLYEADGKGKTTLRMMIPRKA